MSKFSASNIAGTQGKYEKTKNAEENAKATRTTVKLIVELLPNMIKAIKILQGHKVSTKKTKSANTSAKPKYYAQSENATWTIAGEEWSFQKTVGIQAGYEGTKNTNESSKATKYCAQQQKWYINYCRIWYKSSKYCAGTQGNYEKTKNAEENAKATKYCAQQQKWYMN